MKYFLSLLTLIALVVVGRAALPPWTADVLANSAVEAALFRSMNLPQGAILHVRPPAEARDALTHLIEGKPSPELYGLRAREEERAADYAAAEADWKRAGLTDLADFYERRNEPQQEVETILRLPAASADQFQRAIKVASDALLDSREQARVYDAWIARYPQSVEPYQAYLHWSLQNRNVQNATAIAARLKAAFPNDLQLAVTTDAELAAVRNGNAAALAVYAQSFSPLWPEGLRNRYFEELTNAHQLRSFLAQAQAAAASNPSALGPVSQIVFYYEAENRKPAADAELLRFAGRREAAITTWTADELKTMAALFFRLQDYDESARFSYLLTELSSATPSDKETGLAGVIALLLEVPEQPLSFANRDLSLYKNIASMDRHPGFLNGVLTVALNTTEPEGQYANASRTASSYFHRAAASRLLDRLRSEFPAAARLPELEAELFSAYALYGQDEALLRDVPGWLPRNVNAKQYVPTALLLADAYAHQDRKNPELSLYDDLLRTLADRSGHLPIGQAAGAVRSPDYVRVLDRYVNRLVALHRLPDALALLRREIDRNPDDPGLYERLALFVEQNHLDNDLERTYSAALSHFKDPSWASKLARVYLRRRRIAAYEALAKQVADTFKGTELASFLNEVNPNSPTLYRQVNLYAHTRFPHNMQFVTNLLRAYSTKETADYDAYDKLLRENWCNDPGLKSLYFEYLTRDGKLKEILAALPPVDQAVAEKNTAALEFRAEAQSWLTEYEGAAPVLVQLASFAPGERAANDRAATIERSLGPSVPDAFKLAVQLAQQDVKAAPADRDALVRTGEVLADREQYSQARVWWTRASSVRPGTADAYLTTATVFWDYFQFKDALRTIDEGRKRLDDPSLLAYEAGAIDENQSKYKEAVTEYTNAWLHGASEIAQRRLLTLARRPATSALVESQTAGLASDPFETRSFALRIAILEAQNRRTEIEALLNKLASTADTTEETAQVQSVASRLGFDDVAARALARTIAITTDPIEKLTARLDLARFYESHNNAAAAEREYRSLSNDEPNRLGIIRAAVDYEWRAKQTGPAVQLLEAAAARAQQPYRTQLKREAAEKATSSGQYADARRLLDQLLQDDRYNGDYLAEKASTFAREGDTAALTKFYAAALADMTQATLPAQEKTARIAALRRGYILALTTAARFTDALEQYQLVMNAYPEDAALTDEVSRYAEAHQLAPRLVTYYEKSVHDSPRDYRWPLVLARIQKDLGHLQEAIAAYDKAGYVRPDRSDIPLAKVDLQMRLLRFADAIQTYQKLYELSYHDGQYLASEAEAHARLGDSAQAIRLLRAASIEANPKEPAGYIAAMRQANTWHLYEATDSLFQEVRPLLKDRPEWNQQALAVEVDSLVAQHRTDEAVKLVTAGVQEVNGRSPLLRTIALAIDRFSTPAERATTVQQMEQPGGLAQGTATAFAEAAGLRDLEADHLLTQAKTQANGPDVQLLDRLQTSRLLFEQLGQELEAIAPLRRRIPGAHQRIEQQAYQAYTNAGDVASQQRLLNYSGADFATLFISAGGDLNYRLYDLAGQNAARANGVVQHLVATASPDIVQAAISSRGRRASPLWTSSYKALAGLYLATPAAWAQQAFVSSLGPRTVGDQLKGRGAKDALRGPDWFYYAGRYSEYLDARNDPESEEYREQQLEAAPAAASSYRDLGDVMAESKSWDRASVQYEAALQLNPKRVDVYDRLGVLEMRRSRRDRAVEQWRKALQLSTARIEEGPLPPEYWPEAKVLLSHVNQFEAMPDLRADADGLLRTYIKRNGTYELRPLLEGLLEGATDRAAALHWVIELAQLPGAEGALSEMIASPDVRTYAAKSQLYEAKIAAATKAAAEVAGDAAVQARAELQQAELEFIRYLDGQRQWPEVWTRLQQIEPVSERPGYLVLKSGALTGHLTELLTAYKQQPETMPGGEQILQVAAELQRMGRNDLAIPMEEFEYGRELQSDSPAATAYFGLAKVRFAQKKNSEGLSLVRRVTWTVGAPFENLKTAVAELEGAGLKSEALLYADEWHKAEPWNEEAEFAAARLAGDAKGIDAVRRSGFAEYELRVRAARELRNLGVPQVGSDELSLLTHKSLTTNEAEQPFAVEARLDAARSSSDLGEKEKLYREAIAIDPKLQEARWLLADAALSNGQDAVGVAALESVTQPPPARNASYRHAELLAAAVYAGRERYGQAIALYDRLIASETDDSAKASLTKARETASAALKLSQLNGSRLPVVTKDVTQHRLVRPKLTSLPAVDEAIR